MRMRGARILSLACVFAPLTAWVWAESDPADPAPEGVLVLKTGNIMEGRLLKSGEDFEVLLPDSRIFVPGSFVKVQADSKVDAYHLLRKEIPPEGGLPQRMALARWCLSHSLVSQARDELKTVLEVDPSHESARQLMRKIDEILNPKATAEPDVKETLVRARKGLVDEQPTLAGLPRELGSDFVRRIQPILMNNCAQAACHGPQAPSEFRLQRVSSNVRTGRLPTEKNLLEVLKYIHQDAPRASPLITVPQQNHGLRSRPVFQGPKGDDQLAELRSWVVRTVRAQLAATDRKPAPTVEPISVADAPMAAVEAPATESTGTPIELADPFDPAAFNREPR